jgi:hypothetical protein
MNNSDLRTKVLEEVQQIPDEQLAKLYDLIHSFRLDSTLTSSDTDSIMQFAGCWSDLPDRTYTELLEEIPRRRQQSDRRNRETSLD